MRETRKQKRVADIDIAFNATVATILPLTKRGAKWVFQNVQYEPWQLFGAAIACEPRMAEAIASAADEDGLKVA